MNSKDPRTDLIKTLNGLLEREYNSVAKYLLESDPWIPEDQAGWVKGLLQEIADGDRRHAEELVRLIQGFEGSPMFGHYSKDVVDLSYLSILYCMERAVSWKAEMIGLLDKSIESCKPWSDVVSALITIRTEETKHGERLAEALQKLRPPKKEKTPPPADPDAAEESSNSAEKSS